jgi:hypothetical protein
MSTLSNKVLGVLIPPDAEKLQLLRHEMTMDSKNNKAKTEFENILMRCSTSGLMQVKDFHPEERKLEVRTTSLEAFSSNYLLVSQFKLIKTV